MALKRVIAYYTQEKEEKAARAALQSAEVTESFAVGDIDEKDIAALRSAGVIVQEPPAPAAAPEDAEDEAADGAPAPGPFSFAPGVRGGREGAAALAEAVPAAVDWYVVTLRGPLLDSYRTQLAALSVELTQGLKNDRYKARRTAQQGADGGALGFVASVRWISPAQSAPRLATRAVGGPAAAFGVGGAGEPLPFDVRLQAPEDRAKVESWLNARGVTVLGTSARKIRVSAPADDPVLVDLQMLPEVDRIVEYVPPRLFNDAARRLLGLDGPAASPAAAILKQDGSGQVVAVADTGIDDQHPDFQGRIVGKVARGRAGDASEPHGHATHAAGSALGDGAAAA